MTCLSVCLSVCMYVCMYVCLSVSLPVDTRISEPHVTRPNFTKFWFHVHCVRSSALRCVTHFRFRGERNVAYNGRNGGVSLPKQSLCNIMHGLIRLLYKIIIRCSYRPAITKDPGRLRNLKVLSHWPLAESFHTSHMCGNKLRAPVASSIFTRHEGGSLCCGIPRLQPTNQKMECLMSSYSVRCCYWAVSPVAAANRIWRH